MCVHASVCVFVLDKCMRAYRFIFFIKYIQRYFMLECYIYGIFSTLESIQFYISCFLRNIYYLVVYSYNVNPCGNNLWSQLHSTSAHWLLRVTVCTARISQITSGSLTDDGGWMIWLKNQQFIFSTPQKNPQSCWYDLPQCRMYFHFIDTNLLWSISTFLLCITNQLYYNLNSQTKMPVPLMSRHLQCRDTYAWMPRRPLKTVTVVFLITFDSIKDTEGKLFKKKYIWHQRW